MSMAVDIAFLLVRCMGFLMILLMVAGCIGVAMDDWGLSPRPKESPILDRKARFKLYVQGEQQLMADWEAAFDPLRAELARTRSPKWPLASTHMSAHDAYLARQMYVPGGGQAGPMTNPILTFNEYMRAPSAAGGMVWWGEQLDRDQCKLEADHMLSHALITEQEYGPRIQRCNQEMQA